MNKVVIIGGNHHNGLGLIRSFGLNNIPVDAMTVDATIKKSFLHDSKFVGNTGLFKTENEALDYILKSYSDEKEKCVIIPYSDGAAAALDLRLDEFKKKFYVPSINGKQGAIFDLMDKEKQAAFAFENGVPMAKTEVMSLEGDNPRTSISLPVILKPVISSKGDKKDIRICHTEKEYSEAIAELKGKNYNEILVQEFLSMDYEIDVFGAIYKNKDYNSIIPTKTIRAWPVNKGTNSFSMVMTDEKIIAECRKIINTLKNYGYYGLYDIEVFVIGDKVYLNEMNLRNAGEIYKGLSINYFYAVAWYYDVLDMPFEISEYPEKEIYGMVEGADIRHVVFKGMSLKKWLADYKKTSDFALKFPGDMKPAYSRYKYYIKKTLLSVLLGQRENNK